MSSISSDSRYGYQSPRKIGEGGYYGYKQHLSKVAEEPLSTVTPRVVVGQFSCVDVSRD